jgi:hypothetical protein
MEQVCPTIPILIEEGEKNVRKFRENGGYAYQYKMMNSFLNGWNP